MWDDSEDDVKMTSENSNNNDNINPYEGKRINIESDNLDLTEIETKLGMIRSTNRWSEIFLNGLVVAALIIAPKFALTKSAIDFAILGGTMSLIATVGTQISVFNQMDAEIEMVKEKVLKN